MSTNLNINYGNIDGKGFKLFVKKIIRKLISFLVVPIVQQQSRINFSFDERLKKVEHYGEVTNELDEVLQKQSDLFAEKTVKVEKLYKECIEESYKMRKEHSLVRNEIRSLVGDKDYLNTFDQYERIINAMENRIAYLEKKIAELEEKHV